MQPIRLRSFARGDVSPSELLEAALERIEAIDPQLNAVIIRWFDEARDAATHLPDGPFHGVPFLLKDLWAHFAGQPLTNGCGALKEALPISPADTTLVGRFRQAGLNIAGRTNSPEFGSLPTTEPVAWGADAQSVEPRSFARRLQRWFRRCRRRGDGAVRPCQRRWRVHPHPRIVLRAGGSETIAGTDHPRPVPRREQPRSRVVRQSYGPRHRRAARCSSRTGHRRHGDRARATATVRRGSGDRILAGCESVCSTPTRLARRVARRVPRRVHEPPPRFSSRSGITSSTAFPMLWPTATSGAGSRRCGAPTWVSRLSASGSNSVGLSTTTTSNRSIAAQVEFARSVSAVDYALALAATVEFRRSIQQWWADGWDLLLTPTLAEPPATIGTFANDLDAPMTPMIRAAAYVPFTPPFNSSGQPAISLPLHWSSAGLPIGVQLVAGLRSRGRTTESGGTGGDGHSLGASTPTCVIGHAGFCSGCVTNLQFRDILPNLNPNSPSERLYECDRHAEHSLTRSHGHSTCGQTHLALVDRPRFESRRRGCARRCPARRPRSRAGDHRRRHRCDISDRAGTAPN